MADPPARSPTWRRRGLRAEHRALAATLREQGLSLIEIAVVFQQTYGLGAITAMRCVRDWSQPRAAEAWNRLFPDELKTLKNFSYWENWKSDSGRKPDLDVLDKLARLYQCRVSDLVTDAGDYRLAPPQPEEPQRPVVDEQLVEAAFARAESLELEVARRWPHAWSELDRLRSDPPGIWPTWCLLPSAATALVIGTRDSDQPAPVAAVAALYAWRYARSLYMVDPERAAAVTAAGVDELGGVGQLARLPEWCVFIAGDTTQWPGVGLWAHLDYHTEVGRPELRLLLDLNRGGLDTLTSVPIYLDRPTLIEATADARAGLLDGIPYARDGPLDENISPLADAVERLVALVACIARSDTEIRTMDGVPARIARVTRVVRSRAVWIVT